MNDTLIQDKTFDHMNSLSLGEYENCTFNHCDLQESDLSGCRFIDCLFKDCNLSLVKIDRTVFRDVKFTGCKMLGFRSDSCDPFGLSFSFENCQLNHASFYKTKISKTIFRNSQLFETDFTESDLAGAVFDNCELTRAVFDRTNLEKADLRTAYNYSIDPETNHILKARFSIHSVAGLLDKYDIIIES